MKKIVVVFALFLAAQMTFAQDEAFKKDVLKVLELNGTTIQLKMTKDQVIKMIPKSKVAAFSADFDATYADFNESMAKVYMSTYTKEDIKSYLAFYETPLGIKISQKANELAQKSKVVGQDWAKKIQVIMNKYTLP